MQERVAKSRIKGLKMEALITVSLVITILISLFISMLMVAIVILRAAHAQWLLDGHFLSTQLHGIHQVIDSGHGPHGGRVPGLYVPVFPHQQHGEILWADLEVVPHVFDQNAWQTFTVHSCAPYREQRFRMIQEGPQLGWVFIYSIACAWICRMLEVYK